MPDIDLESPTEPFSSPEPKETMTAMGFLEHLEELRKRLVYCVIAIVGGFVVCYLRAEKIYGVVQRPIIDALRHNGMPERLVVTNPVDAFNLYLKTAFVAGLFLASPFVLYQVWLFISPGLYRKEKKYVFPFMFSTIGLFMAGGYFGYKFVFPKALDFLLDYGKQFQPMITVHEYTDLFMTVIVGLGAVFEMPILIFFLALMGVVSAGWMWRNFRYCILGIFIIAAALTPADMMSMCVFAAPMIVLYGLSIGVAWLVHPDQRRKREARKGA